ncbi:hypothetical protein L0F51_19605 [Afifella sp. H1R]|uniref:hypothetical protein n=1 Tax=Afifella sp. H1R TaxID=2908841 RepID=UPI001F3031FB|nr:hypothetical protein [Afifella sp. H1R]MCF1505970.1 hypothetical protein [Afifella sp. H1R]
MAQDQTDRLLALEDRRETAAAFPIEGFDHLDFRTAKLDGFIWNEREEAVSQFDPAGLFTKFKEVDLGYDPANRDLGEIHVYAAKIVPEKVGLAADYGRFLAAEWGPLNFGVQPHTATFGEVMTGRKSEDGQDFTRISVFRRGDELLIIRADGPEAGWGTFGAQVAAFVGSLMFDEDMAEDPVQASFKENNMDVPAVAGRPGAIMVNLPPAWRVLPITSDDANKGVYRFYVDGADEAQNSGAMLFSLKPGRSREVDEESAPELAQVLVGMFLDNVLPDQPREMELMSAGRFSEFDGLVDFNGYYSFKVDFPKLGMPAGTSVFLTVKGGQVAGYAAIAAYPTDMVHRGAALHPTLVEEQLRKGVKSYWERMSESGQ